MTTVPVAHRMRKGADPANANRQLQLDFLNRASVTDKRAQCRSGWADE